MITGDESMRRLGEIHVAAARKHALRLCSFCTAVFPLEWDEQVVEDCTVQLLQFAFHARRINDIGKIDCRILQSVDHAASQISQNDPKNWEKRYDHALNALHHSVSFTFGWVHTDHRQIFLASDANKAPMYVKVKTDMFDEKTISIFGVANCFLIEIISYLKSHQPDWRF